MWNSATRMNSTKVQNPRHVNELYIGTLSSYGKLAQPQRMCAVKCTFTYVSLAYHRETRHTVLIGPNKPETAICHLPGLLYTSYFYVWLQYSITCLLSSAGIHSELENQLWCSSPSHESDEVSPSLLFNAHYISITVCTPHAYRRGEYACYFRVYCVMCLELPPSKRLLPLLHHMCPWVYMYMYKPPGELHTQHTLYTVYDSLSVECGGLRQWAAGGCCTSTTTQCREHFKIWHFPYGLWTGD